MPSQTNYGILGIAPPGLLYIVGDNIWLTRAGRISGVMQIAGSLSNCIRAITQKASQNSLQANFPNRVSWIDELRFCICYLIPYLRFLDKGNEADLKCSPEIEQAVSNIMQQALLLRGRFGYIPGQPIPLELLQKIFCVPCMVSSQQVTALEPVGVPAYSSPNGITVRYQHCTRRTRPLSSVIAELQREIEKRSKEVSTNDFKRETAELMQKVDRLIAHFGPVNMGRFKVIYYDRYHQVHYSRGNFVLVRGPVFRRRLNTGGPIYVGLRILGEKRKNWLKIPPHPCNKPEDLWTPAGDPVLNGICMGHLDQYSLDSPAFTDAEAVVQWLDAGVNIATGISLFHKEYRNRKLKKAQQRNLYSERRQLENERRKSLLSLNRIRRDATVLPDGRHPSRGVR